MNVATKIGGIQLDVQDEIEAILFQMDSWLDTERHRMDPEMLIKRWRYRLKQIAQASGDAPRLRYERNHRISNA